MTAASSALTGTITDPARLRFLQAIAKVALRVAAQEQLAKDSTAAVSHTAAVRGDTGGQGDVGTSAP